MSIIINIDELTKITKAVQEYSEEIGFCCLDTVYDNQWGLYFDVDIYEADFVFFQEEGKDIETDWINFTSKEAAVEYAKTILRAGLVREASYYED